MNASLPVSEIMTRDVITIRPDTPVERIHDLFEKNSFHHIPVIEHGRLAGIVSKTDYLKIRHMISITWSGNSACQELYKGMCAADIMTADPLKIESSDTIGLAADIFKANALHALPVVDEDMLVGIVTSHDLLAYAYREPFAF